MRGAVTAVLVLAMVLGTAVTGVVTAGEKKGEAFLGIYPAEVTSDIAADYGVQAGEGVLVEGVVDDTPAEAIGLRTNDVLVSINNARLTGPAELSTQLDKYKPGDTIDLVYLRGGKQKTVQVKLDRCDSGKAEWWPKIMKFEGSPWEWKESKKHRKVAFAGIVTQSLSEGLAKYFKVEEGALISEVVKGSAAETAGLKAGDIIIKIGDEKIEDEGDVRSAIRDHDPGDAVDFVVKREGVEMTIKVTLGEQYGSIDLEGIPIPGLPPNIELGDLDIDEEDMKEIEAKLQVLEDQLDNLDVTVDVCKTPPATKIRVRRPDAAAINYDPNDWRSGYGLVKDEFYRAYLKFRESLLEMKRGLEDLKSRVIAART